MTESNRKEIEKALTSASIEANRRLDLMMNSVWDDVAYSCCDTEYARKSGFIDGAIYVLRELGFSAKIKADGTATFDR